MPKFTCKPGFSKSSSRQICVAQALEAYIDCNSDPAIRLYDDPV